jgi:integrase
VELLKTQVARKGPDDCVFTGSLGGQCQHRTFYNRHYRPAVQRLVDRGDWPDGDEGLRGLCFHDLRHTCASLLIALGEHPKAISDRLGHSTISITLDRYGHLFPDHDDEMMERLDRRCYRSAS